MFRALLAIVALTFTSSHITVATDVNQFNELWTAMQGHVQTDTQELAKTIWGNICDGCDYTTPSNQVNNSADPYPPFNFPSSEDSLPMYEIFQHFENLARNYIFTPLLDDFPGEPSSTSPAPNEVYAHMMSTLFGYLTEDIGDLYQDMNGHSGLEGISCQGGWGMGWGFTIFADQFPLISYGGGFGAGYAADQTSVSGGGGGGAGFEVFLGQADDDEGRTAYYRIGGGGGGGIAVNSAGTSNPTYGTSSDPDQATPSDAYKQVAELALAAYKAGTLILSGGAGSGGGWGCFQPSTEDSPDGVAVGQYSGGSSLSFVFADPTGSTQPPQDPSAQYGQGLGEAVANCRASCEGSINSPTYYFGCLCPCQKQAFEAVPGGTTWAHNINCQGPSSSTTDSTTSSSLRGTVSSDE